MLTSSARDTLVGVETVIIDEIHAMAHHQARRAPDAHARAARGDHRSAAAAHRAVGHPAAAGGGRRVPRWVRRAGRAAAGDASSTPASASRSRSRSSSRSRTWATIGQVTVELTPRPGDRSAAPSAARSIWPSIYPRILAADPGAPHHDHLLQRPPPGRAPGRQAQRAGRGAGRRRRPETGEGRTSSSRPTTGRWPASSGWSSRTS